MMLWCDGLNVDSVTSKRKRSPGLDGNETDEENCESEKTVSKKKRRSCAQEEREEQVKDTIDKLREKHGTHYSPMQLRIWSEMIQGGIHSSLTAQHHPCLYGLEVKLEQEGRRMIPLPALVRL